MTAFMLKPLEALLPGELDGTKDVTHPDIMTYRLNQPRGRFSKNPMVSFELEPASLDLITLLHLFSLSPNALCSSPFIQVTLQVTFSIPILDYSTFLCFFTLFLNSKSFNS